MYIYIYTHNNQFGALNVSAGAHDFPQQSTMNTRALSGRDRDAG